MNSAKVKLVFNSEKKHVVRYDAPDGVKDPLLNSSYIKKDALPKPFPKEVEVTVSWEGR